MTPVPVILLVVCFELGKIVISSMVLGCIDTVRLIFLTVPCMIVIMLLIVVGASGLLIFSSQHSWCHRYRGHKCGTQHGGTPETGHGCLVLLHAMEQLSGQMQVSPFEGRGHQAWPRVAHPTGRSAHKLIGRNMCKSCQQRRKYCAQFVFLAADSKLSAQETGGRCQRNAVWSIACCCPGTGYKIPGDLLVLLWAWPLPQPL